MVIKISEVEDYVLRQLAGKFVSVTEPERRKALVLAAAKLASPDVTEADADKIFDDIMDFGALADYVHDTTIEDVMVNNTNGVFVFDSGKGYVKLPISFKDRDELSRFVDKLKLYSTNQVAKGNIMDVHLPTGSRANIITSPLGYDVTIRNFKHQPLSVIDLVNNGTLDYKVAARLWVYTDGFRTRPANMLIGGVPAAGKTTLLNTMFSFLRPEQRIVTIEETYELNTSTQENAVRLETSEDMPMVELVKNALRMRPDLIVIGEVRGAEANDMMAAMNIGKISMGTIHASSTRDIINRLEHSPMNVPRDIIPVIDALMIISVVYTDGRPSRKVIQMSEISGIESQVLISDTYKYDYKTHRASPMMPSVTYRDTISKLLGIAPADILGEEAVRAMILEQLNKTGKRDMRAISEAVKEYYDNPQALLKKVGLSHLEPVITV